MWSIIIATVLINTKGQETPVLVSTYPTLRECRLELINAAKSLKYELVVSPLFGYAIKKNENSKITVGFCVQNKESV